MPCLLGKMLIALQSLICASKITNQQSTGCAAGNSSKNENNSGGTGCAANNSGGTGCAANNSGCGMNNMFLILGIVLACLYVKKMKSTPMRGGRRRNNHYEYEEMPYVPPSSRYMKKRYNRRCDRDVDYRYRHQEEDPCIINQMVGNCTPSAGCLIKTLFILKCLTMC